MGVIIYIILSGASPFYSDNNERAFQNITEIRYSFPQELFSDVSSEAKDLIEELLIHDQRLVLLHDLNLTRSELMKNYEILY